MTSPADILGNMIANADEQSENIQSGIDQVQEQIDAYNEKINGVENGMCGVDATALMTYLDSTKVIELLYLDADIVDYGPEYGTINYTTGGITDFSILDTTGNVIYRYEGINWDSDSIIQRYIDDYDFGNDYLTRPLTSGASYGLIPNRDNLIYAKSILTENKNKVVASKTTFEPYT